MENFKSIWRETLMQLEVETSAISFDVWIKPLEPLGIFDGKLILMAPGEVGKESANARYRPLIQKAACAASPEVLDVLIIEPSEKELYIDGEAPAAVEEEKPQTKSTRPESMMINPKYNFENFVIGKSNQFVCAAAHAVSDEPGVRYNPLFIYGGVGLGKTHIMHAIGNNIRISHPHLKLLYVSSETFLTEFIDHIGAPKAKSGNFREKYRSVDVLMIDDIQLIEGKKSTQEEMFHTFNDLYQANKQLIFTSDKPPKELPGLEERLRSRFEWGMIADIQPPDVETRIAILQKKAQLANYNIALEVLTFMAENMDGNIREMESLLNKVIFLAKLSEKAPNIELAREALKDYGQSNDDAVSSDDILTSTCRYFNVTKQDLIGKKKNKEIVEPRQICIYLITEMMALPLATIGNLFGGRDHTTIMHARDKIAEKIGSNVKLKLQVQDIKDMVYKK